MVVLLVGVSSLLTLLDASHDSYVETPMLDEGVYIGGFGVSTRAQASI